MADYEETSQDSKQQVANSFNQATGAKSVWERLKGATIDTHDSLAEALKRKREAMTQSSDE